MKIAKTLSTVLSIALLVLALALPATTPAFAQDGDYRIQPGDQLRVEVLEDASLNREVLVAPDGRISVPLVGVIRVGGRTLDQAQEDLVLALSINFATPPTVLVSLVRLTPEEELTEEEVIAEEEEEPIRLYVMGEVNNPGLLPAPSGISLLQALALAGGVSDFAATKRIQLRRIDPASGEESVFQFNYDEVIEGKAGVGTSTLLEGDIIVVPTRRLFE